MRAHAPGALGAAPFADIAALPERLEFVGEFGAEINSFVPFIHWLHLAGLMPGRRIRTYRGMRPFYFFLDAGQIEETDAKRHFVFPEQRPSWLPTRDDHASRRTAFEVFPDYRARFRTGMFRMAKPLLVIHNKVTPEWDLPPVNVLPLDLLDHLFRVLAPRFHIVYLRPGLLGVPAGYSADHQPDLAFADLELLRRHPEVELFDEMAATLAHAMPYNEVKLRLYAHADFHITVQGGNAHLLSLFSGGLVAILHRLGQEIRHSYLHGHFSYAASPPPRWLICRDAAQLARCIPLFQEAQMVAGQVLLGPRHAGTVQALSPAAQCGDERCPAETAAT